MIIGITEYQNGKEKQYKKIEITGELHRKFPYQDIYGEDIFEGDLCIDIFNHLCEVRFRKFQFEIHCLDNTVYKNLESLFDSGYQLKKLQNFQDKFISRYIGAKFEDFKLEEGKYTYLPYTPDQIAQTIIREFKNQDLLLNYFDLQKIMFLLYLSEFEKNKIIFRDYFTVTKFSIYPYFLSVKSKYGINPISPLYFYTDYSNINDSELQSSVHELVKKYYDFKNIDSYDFIMNQVFSELKFFVLSKNTGFENSECYISPDLMKNNLKTIKNIMSRLKL